MMALLLVPIVVASVIVVALVYEGDHTATRSDWAFGMVQLDEANRMGLTGQGVRVGIVDTGIDATHQSLAGVHIVAWRDLVGGRPDPYDDEGHGTAMASIIAGRPPLMGGVPDVELVIVKVIDAQGTSTDTLIADGIDFCLDPNGDGDYADGADIISLSLGGKVDRIKDVIASKTRDAINEAISSGVLVVAAAGNDGGPGDDGDVSSPGWIPEVVCVGAVDRNGNVASFSSTGRNAFVRHDPNKKPEVVAPGVDISTAYPDGRYAKGSGTSQATALASAALAAALGANPAWQHDGARGGDRAAVLTIKGLLMDTSKKVTGQTTPHDDRAGYGIIQAVALERALSAA
jgi:subtilisin family serine protease